MLTVTRRFEISYSHRLPCYNGNCAKLHGHNAMVEVTFTHGTIDHDNYPGMVVDFKEINSKVGNILDQFDHAHLNEMEFFTNINPTAENMALIIAQEIKCHSGIKAKLVSVKVTETSDSWAIWYEDSCLGRSL